MLRTALAMFLVGCIAASGQTQNGATGGADKVDRASAYYHYALAHMYAEMAAATGSNNREYEDKSIENYKAALKADPQAPALLQGIRPFFPLWIPAARPTRIVPKADPSK
jgi:hypothetical protein